MDFGPDPNSETQSEFNAGVAIAMSIQHSIEMGNAASRLLTMEGIRSWWLNLEDVYRFIAPRVKRKELKDRLEGTRVVNIPMRASNGSQQAIIFFYRRRLTAYQLELEYLRDMLGLGIKKNDNPGMALLRG